MVFQSPPDDRYRLLPPEFEEGLRRALAHGLGALLLAGLALSWLALLSWSVTDPSLTHATRTEPGNLLGHAGAVISDLMLQTLGLGSALLLLAPMPWALDLTLSGATAKARWKFLSYALSLLLIAGALSCLPRLGLWPLNHGYGGIVGDGVAAVANWGGGQLVAGQGSVVSFFVLGLSGAFFVAASLGVETGEMQRALLGLGRRRRPRQDARKGTGPRPADLRQSPAPSAPEPKLSLNERIRETSGRHWQEPETPGVDWFPKLPENNDPEPMPGEPPFETDPSSARDTTSAGDFETANEKEPSAPGVPQSPRVVRAPDFVQAFAKHAQGPDDLDDGSSRGAHFDDATDNDSLDIAKRFAPNRHPSSVEESVLKRALRRASQAAPRRAVEVPEETEGPSGTGGVEIPTPPEAQAGEAYSGDSEVAGRSEREPKPDEAAVTEAATGSEDAAPSAPATPASGVTGPDALAGEDAGSDDVAACGSVFEGRLGAAEEAATGADESAEVAPGTLEVEEPARPKTDDDRAADAAPVEQTASEPKERTGTAKSPYRRPSLNLLKAVPPSRPGPEMPDQVVRGTERLLKDVLSDFGIEGEVAEVRPGPVITSFEVALANGINPVRVASLADDIARGVGTSSARVAIKGDTGNVAIELPNVYRRQIALRDLMSSSAFRSFNGVLPVAAGLSDTGQPVVADLPPLASVLITGEPDTGKTTFLRSLLLSMIFRTTPDDCRFLIFDPTLIEFGSFNGTPQLHGPVISGAEKACEMLDWLGREVDERAKRMARLSARTIDLFNNRVRNARKRGELIARTVRTGFCERTGQPVYEHEQMSFEPMPNLVVLIDDLSRLMEADSAATEQALTRIAERGRNVGIFLVATTKTTCDLCLTPAVKAAFASVLTFKLRSRAQSRQVLDTLGAEQLLPFGDALLLAYKGQMSRIHTPLVTRDEAADVCEVLRGNGSETAGSAFGLRP